MEDHDRFYKEVYGYGLSLVIYPIPLLFVHLEKPNIQGGLKVRSEHNLLPPFTKVINCLKKFISSLLEKLIYFIFKIYSI